MTDSNLVDDGGARREDGRHRRHPGLTLGPQDLDVEAPDPPEGQINRFEWTSSGPSGFTVRASTQPVPALPVGPGPYADLPLMNDFVTMLNGIRGAPESGQRDGAEQTGVRTEWNDNARFNTVTRHGGGPTYTYTTTARLYPTDPGQPLTAGQTTAAIPT